MAGIIVTGILVTGIVVTVIVANGIVANGIVLSGIVVTGIVVSAIVANGIVVTGIVVSGIVVSGIVVTGIVVTGGRGPAPWAWWRRVRVLATRRPLRLTRHNLNASSTVFIAHFLKMVYDGIHFDAAILVAGALHFWAATNRPTCGVAAREHRVRLWARNRMHDSMRAA